MNRLTRTAVIIAGLSILFFPAAASGQGADERTARFCSQAAERHQAISASLADKRDAFAATQTGRIQKTVERRAAVDDALTQSRGATDGARARSYELLIQNQESDSHRAAATFYTASVEAAVTARRAAFDGARLVFRQQIDSLHAGREQATQDRLAELADILDTAHETADTQCDRSRANHAAIRDAYIETLRSARQSYAGFRQENGSASESIGEYAAVRNDAYEAAVTEFERAMRTARETFETSKTAMPSGN